MNYLIRLVFGAVAIDLKKRNRETTNETEESVKIYEIRDITDDESYYTKGFFTDKAKAIDLINCHDGYDLADDPSCHDCVIMAVYEWETEMFEKGNKKIFEVIYSSSYQETEDDCKWTHEVTFPKSEAPTVQGERS